MMKCMCVVWSGKKETIYKCTCEGIYVYMDIPQQWSAYKCGSWLRTQSCSESEYSKSSTSVSSCLRRSSALAITSGATSTAPPMIGVFGMLSSCRPVASSPGKSHVLPKDMHWTSTVSWCLENDRTPLGSLRITTSHPRLARSGAKKTCSMWRGKANDCAEYGINLSKFTVVNP